MSPPREKEEEEESVGKTPERRYSSQIGPENDGEEVLVGGWVHEYRNLGGIAFVQLRDRDGIVQITLLKKKDDELFSMMTDISRESVLTVRGKVQSSDKAKAGFEIIPDVIDILSVADTPLPMGVADKVGVELDTRLDNRFLDLRRNEVVAIFKIRSTMLSSVKDVLGEEEFMEVHTPKIVATATEGGTSLFKMEYFDRQAYLNQSPQLYKQILMATGMDRIFEIGPAFRAEEHDTVRHLNEFTSIDIEMAFSTEEDAMDVLEKVVVRAVEDVMEINSGELEVLGAELERPVTPFPRVRFERCVDMVKKKGVEASMEDDLSMEADKVLGKEFPGYYFITHWPKVTKPFYAQPYDEEEHIVKGFDLMFGEKEITSGAQRVHDPEILEEKIRGQGLDPDEFEFYLKPFRFGIPPHAGWGLGVERLLMIMTGRRNIRECVLFPRDRKRLIP